MKKVTVPLLALAFHKMVSGAERPNIRDVVNQRFDEMLSMARNLEARPSQAPQTTPLQDSAAREDFMKTLLNQLVKAQTELAETKVALANFQREKEDLRVELVKKGEEIVELQIEQDAKIAALECSLKAARAARATTKKSEYIRD